MKMLMPVLNSLIEQAACIDQITLWIPQNYRRKEFNDFVLPAVPEGVEIRRSKIDYGPATKILPAVKQYKDDDVRIIYCDDDRTYPPEWAAGLISASDRHPDACICEAGENIKETFRRAHFAVCGESPPTLLPKWIYKSYLRKRLRASRVGVGPVNIAKGFGGVLIRPQFVPESAFDIPDVLWTVDDIWLSGSMALNGTPIWKSTLKETSCRTVANETDALLDFVEQGYNRNKANIECIRYFTENYAIWNDTREFWL